MTLEQRFTTTFREAESCEPGLVLENDGTVWLINPDCTRTQVGVSGAALSAAIVQGGINPEVTGIPQGYVNFPFPIDPVGFTVGGINADAACGPATIIATGFFFVTGASVVNVDTTNSPYALTADVYVWNAGATETIQLHGAASASAGVPGDSADISHSDLSVNSQVGTDLSYNASNGHIISAAGGTFSGLLAISGSWG